MDDNPKSLLTALLLVCYLFSFAQDIPSFPEAEGFGARLIGDSILSSDLELVIEGLDISASRSGVYMFNSTRNGFHQSQMFIKK